MLNLVRLLSLLFTITMRLISAVQHSLAVSLTKGFSQHKIQTTTGLGKGTVGKINNEVERNKENHSGVMMNMGHPRAKSDCPPCKPIPICMGAGFSGHGSIWADRYPWVRPTCIHCSIICMYN